MRPDPKRLARHHVIVTSYNTVSYEWKAYAGDGKAEGTTKSKGAKDTLFRLEWYRVILGRALVYSRWRPLKPT
jgi:hypothetical protein